MFRSDLYCIEFFIPFEIEVEIVLKSLQRMLNAIVAIELTGVVLGAFDVFVDTDFYTETFFKSFHQFVERFVLEVVDAVFPQLGFEGADYRLLELAVFELCPVSGFEHRAFFARRYFYRTLDERDHEVFFFECGSYVEFGSQYFNFSVRRIYDKWFPMIETETSEFDTHEYLKSVRHMKDDAYLECFDSYARKYSIPPTKKEKKNK